MPRKPAPRGSSGRKSDDPLRLEQKRLLDEQEALIRKQEEARRVIEDAPRKLQQLKKRQREPILINLKASRAGQKSFGLPHDKYREATAAEPRQRRKRKSERNMAKLQFIILVAILFAIVVMMLRAVPH